MPAQDQNTSQKFTSTLKIEPLKTLLEWRAPVRPFKKRDREFFTTVGAIVFLLAVILLFLKEWLLIAVIVAITFVVYVMGTIAPEDVNHKITNRGVVSGEKSYNWDELGRFWFSEKWGQKILQVETNLRFPRRLLMLLGETNQEEAKKILSDYLLFEEPEKTWMDKASNWLTRNIPLEKSF